jgi:predicted GNAT family acetyltransferase
VVPAPRRRVGACELAVKRDLARLPEDLRKGGIAASVVVMAQGMDSMGVEVCPHCGEEVPVKGNSLTSMTMAQARLQEALAALRALAPPKETHDGIDEIAQRRAERREGLAKASDLPHP